ncbi:unnamed protein product [Phytophthora fragariaefolia]|uniref:Unnamed protein product n=1 Tax=Phytophthora fragariaefolia TaxID=1490495 RepID=A0A9W6X9G5_9STRA|nr:unnamed protein product [Phytophthora fragariaefolia]
MNDQIPNIHAIMSQHLTMDLRQKDVKVRVLNYFDRFDELVEGYGLSIALDGNDKLKCKLLTENLRVLKNKSSSIKTYCEDSCFETV